MMPPRALAKMAENLRPSTLQWCSRRAAAVAVLHGAHYIASLRGASAAGRPSGSPERCVTLDALSPRLAQNVILRDEASRSRGGEVPNYRAKTGAPRKTGTV
jgi:hypothetical protein